MDVKTKIICTMGPSVNSFEKICELIDAGMNVARLNFSHGTHQDHIHTISLLKKAREEKKVPLAIMLDTKGPEIRIGKLVSDALHLSAGQHILLVKDEIQGTEDRIQILPAQVLEDVKKGYTILFDDGYIISKVIDKTEEGVLLEIQNPGILKSHKGINIPNAAIRLPALTDQDKEDIMLGCAQDVDMIAASFIRSEEHVLEIKKLLNSYGKPDILVIAKIENPEGVTNFDSIIHVADGIMVARGDLGVEVPLEEVPSLQKMMINKCRHMHKPVVTATQMLESMIKNPRPTRAEVSDVANAIYDGTSAVMLSGETSVGAYPIETVRIMKKIAKQAELNVEYRNFLTSEKNKGFSDVSSAVAYASVQTAYITSAKAIFAYTFSGHTARLISHFRPEMPIISLTGNTKVYHQMALYWGVVPVDPFSCKNEKESFEKASSFAVKQGLVGYGDLVVITSGIPFGICGTTNTMSVESIGDVLVRGYSGQGMKIHGRVCILMSCSELFIEHAREKIVVLARCSEEHLPILSHALGIVLENADNDKKSEKIALDIAKSLGIPIIIRARGAMNSLKEGQVVTMDPSKGILFQ
ncbi:MAG: pyruvate kinase [Chlamydiae bacterium]|nr:pyruvate kinase [Chlamydiota bacterium]